MAHTYFAVYAHIVWSTKNRRPWIDPDMENEIYAYLATVVRNQDCEALLVGGHRDHVHLLTGLSSTLLVPDLVKETKRITTNWLKKRVEGFRWQDGYGAFSVSYSNLDQLRQYIGNQHKHHKRMTWEEEFRGLLEKHGIAYDEAHFLD